MKMFLAGASGQLGQELLARLGALGEVTAVDRSPDSGEVIEQDLSDLHQLEITLNRLAPNLVINAAAYTAVDQAEKDHHTAFRLNAELPACMARWCERNGSLLLHYSTDYVFDGSSGKPYRETDQPDPLNVYGQSKLAGEWAVAASGCQHLIVRTSWVYSTHGKNFVLSMLKLARERSELSIVSDQTGCPTWARNLAQASCAALQYIHNEQNGEAFRGTYHYCDSTVTTWYDFARIIFEQAAELRLLSEIPRLKSIRSVDFPQIAKRPEYSVLDCSAITRTFGINPPGLQASLRACLEELVS